MAARFLHGRGDIAIANKDAPVDGQLFLSYVNTDPYQSRGHSYSEGQLWAKLPNNQNYTELANARAIDSLKFQGYMPSTFKGDFVNANEYTQAKMRHCHVGDFWIMSQTDLENYKVKLYKGDILLITNTEYEPSVIGEFREKLKSVDYVRIPLSNVEALANLQTEDLEDTLRLLEKCLRYAGELSTIEEFYNLSKKVGNFYVVTKQLTLAEHYFVVGESRQAVNRFVNLRAGDLIWYNGDKWEVVPSGQSADTVTYKPNKDLIDAVPTFEEWQKQNLKAVKTVQEALDLLASSKAQLDENGKISYSQLPEALKNSLSLQDKFYPIVVGTKGDYNNPDNQNPWPIPKEPIRSGFYWIVDCQGQYNVQYEDKTKPGRILELNTKDWIVWIEATQQFEVINSGDGVTAINVIDSTSGERVQLVDSVNVKSTGTLKVHAASNSTLILEGEHILGHALGTGKDGYLPMFTGDGNYVVDSSLKQDADTLKALISLQVGQVDNPESLNVFGNAIIRKTAGATAEGFVNNFIFFEDAKKYSDGEKEYYRYTGLRASSRDSLHTTEDTIKIDLPEASSMLLGIFADDALSVDYHTKTIHDGFVTDSLTSEILVSDPILEADSQDGYTNIGIGRLTTEDTETGEITFYAKAKDAAPGFRVNFHSFSGNEGSKQATLREHFLNREAPAKTRVVINPTVLEDEIETLVKLPMVSGTISTWEELAAVFGSSNSKPLTLPVWEEMNFRHGKFIGLDNSPIHIKVNRPAHDNVTVERVNDLAADYGNDSTFSYIDSSKEGSLEDAKSGSVDDVVTFDAWVEARRSIATKEAFILPATAIKDGASTLDQQMNWTEDKAEVAHTGYGKNASGGKYQRILPSRSLYKSESVYYDPITDKLIPQDVTTKDVEMPAVGGVLLTSRSRIEGGYWA